jgi:predicted SAM-dependent methyltransferase
MIPDSTNGVRTIMALPKGTKALNLGCGDAVITDDEAWVNIDNSPGARLAKYPWLKWTLWKGGILTDHQYRVNWHPSVVVADLNKGLNDEDNSVGFVYTSHFLEHVDRDSARKLLVDILRVLRPGGLLRVVVPDLAYGARRYLDALRDNPSDSEAAPTFLKWLDLRWPGERTPHLWMYDAPSLTRTLTEVGFVNVATCQFQQGRFPDLQELDKRPGDSLHIEAEKPGGES